MKKEGAFAVLIIFLIIIFSEGISATSYCINPVVSDISPSSIGIDQEFTVGILLDNCGDQAPQNITFELKDISPEITVKEPLVRNLTEIGSLGDRFLLYHMKTSNQIIPGDYYINYKLEYSGGDGIIYPKEGSFVVTVTGNKAELSIASSKTNPVMPLQGQAVELTLRIENYGKGTANSIRVLLNHNFSGSREAFIGTLSPDEDGPAVFTFIPKKNGDYIIPVKIFYQDDFGQKEFDTSVEVYVSEADSGWLYILFGAIIILIIGTLIFYLFKIKRTKEKIIHQLLRGSHPEKKKILKRK